MNNIGRNEKQWPALLLVFFTAYMQLAMAGASGKRVHSFGNGPPVSPSDFSGFVKINHLGAKLFFLPTDSSNYAIDNYVSNRHEILTRLSKEDPDKELHAQISFNYYISAAQLILFVNTNRLTPISLNIGWKENGGGYDLKEDESIEEAVKSATLHHTRFIAQLLEDANLQVSTLGENGVDDFKIQSELAFQKHANELAFAFQTKGILFYGIRVIGSAKHLQALAQDDKEKIRLIDPLWGGSTEKETANLYPIAKIAMPIVPDNPLVLP